MLARRDILIATILLAAFWALPLLAQDNLPAPPATMSAGDAATQEEEPPATTTATTPAYAPPNTSPLPMAASVAEGLQLDAAERIILDAVKDRSRNLTDSGLYVLLRRAIALPPLDAAHFDTLSTFNTEQLLTSPERFRGLPLRLAVRVYKVQEWTPGVEFRMQPRWPRERKIWCILGQDYTGKRPTRKDIVVLSVVDPRPLLGDPDKSEAGGTVALYSVGRYLELAGVFYKVYGAMSLGNSKVPPAMTNYPVVVAWQVGKSEAGPDSMQWMWTAATLSLAALIFLFFFFRHRAKQAKIANPRVGFRGYRPMREEEPPPPEHKPPADEADQEVDPALREAAERYRKEKRNG